MGKLTSFQIAFSNQMGVYYAGQILQGNVCIELAEAMSMRGLRLELKGKATVHWTEQRSSGKHTHTVTYHNEEIYFFHEIILFGKSHHDTRDTLEMAAGTHVYPFQLQLFPTLPSSFEGQVGHVRYTARAIIDRPWRFDHTCKHPFTVISLFDLNTRPDVLSGVQGNNQKTLCCWCCKSGPISATFHIRRKGYVPGEAVLLYAEIENLSNRRMCKSYVELKQVCAFHARTKTKWVTSQLGTVERPEILPGKGDQWNGEKLVIPPIPPSELPGCNIIDIRYYVQLNVDPAGPAFDLEVPLEVVIGNIPLRQVLQENPPLAPVMPDRSALYGSATAPSISMAPIMPPSMPENIPPPAYSESAFGKVDVRDQQDDSHTRGDSNFAPVYAYYNWGHESTFSAK